MLPEIPKGMHIIHQDIGPLRDVFRARSTPVSPCYEVKQAHAVHPLRERRLPLVNAALIVTPPDRHPLGRNPFVRNLSFPDQLKCLIHDATDVTQEHIAVVGQVLGATLEVALQCSVDTAKLLDPALQYGFEILLVDIRRAE